MKKHTGIISALLISALLQIPGATSGDWILEKNSSGIQVYLRPVQDSQVKEFMAVTVTESTLSAILALLDDTPSYTRWNYRCSEARLLYKKNDMERITYMVTTSPWPVEDRDIAVKSVIYQDRKTGIVTITLTGLPGYLPVKQGRVRMAGLKGFWILEPLGSGRVKVTYRLHTEPGGSVPDSIVNSSLVDIPFNTLYNMKKMVQIQPYRDSKYNTIHEK